ASVRASPVVSFATEGCRGRQADVALHQKIARTLSRMRSRNVAKFYLTSHVRKRLTIRQGLTPACIRRRKPGACGINCRAWGANPGTPARAPEFLCHEYRKPEYRRAGRGLRHGGVGRAFGRGQDRQASGERGVASGRSYLTHPGRG